MKFISACPYIRLRALCLASSMLGTLPALARAADTVADTETVIVQARHQRHAADFRSGQTVKVLDQDQIRAVSVVAGVAKALSLVPGVSTTTYGWAGFSGGNPDNGSIGVTFDGVPMSNPGNGLWQSTLVPQTSLLQTMNVTYGPGNPMDRWYTNIGGGLAFVPLQPSSTPGGEIIGTYGSFNTANLSFDLQTGNIDGWETVIAGGLNHADSYLKAPGGFSNNSDDYAFYLKTRKSWDSGNFSFGAYAARSGAYRPLATPLTPIPGVSINGYDKPGPAFSEQTTGLYTTLPGSVNYKYDSNSIKLFYANLDQSITDAITFHGLAYVTDENRQHWTPLHDFVLGSESQYEINQPSSYAVGFKPVFEWQLPKNDMFVGGYWQYSQYHSQEQLYNPNLGFVASPVPVPPGIMGSQSAPNGNYFSDLFYTQDAAIFWQDTFKPFKNVSIEPGIRWVNYGINFNHNENSQFPLAVLYNPGGESSQFPASSRDFSRFEPSVSGNWNVWGPLAVYASWGQDYRTPENGGGTGPYVALPASAVQLEQGTYWQSGIKLRMPQLGFVRDIYVDASYYHLNFNNETIPTALASGGALLSFGSSVYEGVNLIAEAQILPNFYVFGNLGTVSAYFTRYVNGNGIFSNIPVANTPNANGNLGAYYRYQFQGGTLLPRLSYVYTGAQHLYNDATNITSSQKFAAYGVVNASTELDLDTLRFHGAHGISITFEVDNLLGARYNTFEYISAGGLYGAGGFTNPQTVGAGATLGIPAPGRAFYGSVGVKF
ncbi:MAG: TonB-dependent receptor [Acidocella sp.]|nr:TonB-dependent receptor [Acidocella sp.]